MEEFSAYFLGYLLKLHTKKKKPFFWQGTIKKNDPENGCR
jgi:hypothetical protein